MSIKKKRRISIRIDMTPMVDIAFLLLIFYMSTTQFKPPEAKKVTLPKSHSQIELPDKDVINITVTKLDSMYVDFLQKEKMVVEGKEVTTTVRKYSEVNIANVSSVINRARAVNPRALIVIKADKDASFGAMNDLMNSMKENELTRFLIITDNERELASATPARQ
ncbi:Biopolymer transport protein ExbD/TolR [Candidatus Zixiibacteriota bacterium]|nr:Biopolymer transport protein ExbD/TolR [candidate division Zixibacteria bacterium]